MKMSFGGHVCLIPGSGMPVLDWDKRLKIAIGAAKGLAYLHEDCKYIFFSVACVNIFDINSNFNFFNE